MVARSDLTPLGLRLAGLLVQGSAVAAAPSASGVVSLGKSAYEEWRAIAALGKRGSEATDALGKEIASRLTAAVKGARRRHKEQGLDVELLPGAATEVAALLEQVASDGGVVVAAVQDPDRFEDLLNERGQEFRKNVEEKAEPLFDELVRTVAREFTSLAPGSSRFTLAALKELLNNDSEALAILHRMEAKQEASHNDIAEIKADVKDIAKVVNTPHAPVPAPPSRIRFGSRPANAVGFVSRREQEDLFSAVFSGVAPRTVLVGMHGCGKSQLAAAVAARCIEEEWPLVAWVNAESRQSVLEGLSELGQRMGVGETDDRTPETLARRCLEALEEAEEADRLVVFDNVERADDLRDLVPRGEGLRVVATTTKRVDWEQAHWTPIRVGVFEREQSITMLLDRTGQTDRDAANTIADALGDLPVAVSQAAATIKRSRCGFATYLDRLRKYSLEDSVRRLDGDEYPAAVGAALKLAVRTALEEIGKQNPRWEEIASLQLGVLALLAASGVPRRWLEGTDQDSSDRSSLDASEALNSLVEFSVCQLSEDGAKAMLHRLQGRVIRENWKNEPKEQAHAEEEAIDLLSSVDTTRVRNPKNGARRQDAVDLADQLRAVSEQDYSHALFSDPRFCDFFHPLCGTQQSSEPPKQPSPYPVRWTTSARSWETITPKPSPPGATSQAPTIRRGAWTRPSPCTSRCSPTACASLAPTTPTPSPPATTSQAPTSRRAAWTRPSPCTSRCSPTVRASWETTTPTPSPSATTSQAHTSRRAAWTRPSPCTRRCSPTVSGSWAPTTLIPSSPATTSHTPTSRRDASIRPSPCSRRCSPTGCAPWERTTPTPSPRATTSQAPTGRRAAPTTPKPCSIRRTTPAVRADDNTPLDVPTLGWWRASSPLFPVPPVRGTRGARPLPRLRTQGP